MGWSAVLQPWQCEKPARGARVKQHAMSQILNAALSAIGIDSGKNSFDIAGHDHRGAIVLRLKRSGVPAETRLPASLAMSSISLVQIPPE